MRISLCGAAREVTGSGYLVETATARVLVDFGMFQGGRATEARNRDIAPVDPLALDAIIATHAHLDHTGRLPMLLFGGFRGTADELQALIVRDRAETLERRTEPLRRDGVAVSTEVLRGRRHIEMVRQVLRGGHHLLMKEAEPNEDVLFGSTDMHLLRTCPCPAWLVKPGHGERLFSQVLAPVDPAPPPDEEDLLHIKEDVAPKDLALDAKILELSGSLAESDGAELHVLHVWSAPGEGALRQHMFLGLRQVEHYVEDSRAEARKALDGLLAESPDRTGRRFVHLLKGDPADAIAEFAKSGRIDLIVMGTVARTGVGGLLIGDTAETVLQRVDCSVLAVKPAGFISPVGLDQA
jgi:nucleotide-binding universal stress UspA family protein